MAATINFVGSGNNIVWGTNVVTNFPNTVLTVISASVENAAETIPVLTNVGIPDGFVIIPGISTASIEGYANGNAAAPAVGSISNIAGANFYTETTRINWEQKGIKRVSITGKALPS
jgi:hypothetical protein